MTRLKMMHADSSTVLSLHSAIALSRCSSLHGSILARMLTNGRAVLEAKSSSAAHRAARPVHLSIHAKESDIRGSFGQHGSLAEERPDLARQWVPDSNGSVTPDSVAFASRFKAAWRCGEGCEHCGMPHEWTTAVANRSLNGTGCPLCAGQKVCRCRSVAAMHPELMEQWDWEGNQGIDPYSVGCSSTKKVFWMCAEHGQWKAVPHQRVYYGTGCPKCARQRRLGYRPQQRGLLKDRLPDIYAELHPTKNAGIDVEKLTCGSAKRVWWLCQSNESRPEGCQHEHEWETKVQDRCSLRKIQACPFCDGARICPCKSLARLQPIVVQCWDFAGNAIPLQEPLDPSCMSQHSQRKVWWRHECADGQVHNWRSSIANVVRCFTLRGRVPCPVCAAATRAASRAERASGPGNGRLIKRT